MQKIFANKKGGAVFTCPHCGFVKPFDASAYRDKDSRLTIKCQCGQQVPVLIEFREQFRKQVSLSGECLLHRTNTTFNIRISDISLSGLGFILLNSHSEKNIPFVIGDTVSLKFYLDNANRDLISQRATIKNIQREKMGVRFIRAEYDKTLGFYLMQ